jgi:hypothetical protein
MLVRIVAMLLQVMAPAFGTEPLAHSAFGALLDLSSDALRGRLLRALLPAAAHRVGIRSQKWGLGGPALACGLRGPAMGYMNLILR